jgi:hypothetical protein
VLNSSYLLSRLYEIGDSILEYDFIKKDSSSLSPLEGLLDLLIDLQVVNPTQKPSEESPH